MCTRHLARGVLSATLALADKRSIYTAFFTLGQEYCSSCAGPESEARPACFLLFGNRKARCRGGYLTRETRSCLISLRTSILNVWDGDDLSGPYPIAECHPQAGLVRFPALHACIWHVSARLSFDRWGAGFDAAPRLARDRGGIAALMGSVPR